MKIMENHDVRDMTAEEVAAQIEMEKKADPTAEDYENALLELGVRV